MTLRFVEFTYIVYCSNWKVFLSLIELLYFFGFCTLIEMFFLCTLRWAEKRRQTEFTYYVKKGDGNLHEKKGMGIYMKKRDGNLHEKKEMGIYM